MYGGCYGTLDRLYDPRHALPRMSQRNVQRGDVINALQNGRTCVQGNKLGRWKITGPDLDDQDLQVVIVFELGVVVVTVFDGG